MAACRAARGNALGGGHASPRPPPPPTPSLLLCPCQDMDACDTSPAREAAAVTVGATDASDRRLWLAPGEGGPRRWGGRSRKERTTLQCPSSLARLPLPPLSCRLAPCPSLLSACRQGLKLRRVLGHLCPRHRHPLRRRLLRQRAAVSAGGPVAGRSQSPQRLDLRRTTFNVHCHVYITAQPCTPATPPARHPACSLPAHAGCARAPPRRCPLWRG